MQKHRMPCPLPPLHFLAKGSQNKDQQYWFQLLSLVLCHFPHKHTFYHIVFFGIEISQLVLTKPLTYLYNLCLASGTCPLAWKKAIIKPLYKSGTKTQFKNYRPISNSSFFPELWKN